MQLTYITCLTFLPSFIIYTSRSLRNNFTLNAHVIALIVILLADTYLEFDNTQNCIYAWYTHIHLNFKTNFKVSTIISPPPPPNQTENETHI